MLKDEAITKIIGALFWKPEQFQAAVIVMKERPHKRKLKTLPLSIAQLERVFPIKTLHYRDRLARMGVGGKLGGIF